MVIKRILLKTHQGSGKGRNCISLVEQVIERGGTVAIAVPTHAIAVEVEKLLAHLTPLALASHKKHFEGREKDCPRYEEIQAELQVRQTAKNIRKRFCDSCPARSSCRYVGQYQKILDSKHRLIVAQHAHLVLPEVRENLDRRGLSLLWIDEDIYETLRQPIRVEKWHLELLKAILAAVKDNLLQGLSNWLEFGGTPGRSLTVKERRIILEHMKSTGVLKKFEEIMALVDVYNSGHSIASSETSILVKTLPRASVQLFTDATADIELLKLVLEDPSIELFDGGVFDPRKVHPGNEVIQLLDLSTSITNLQGPEVDGEHEMEKFTECLFFIGEMVIDRDLQKPLVTTYKDWIPIAETILRNNFPDVFERFRFGHMEAGTNRFEDCDAQFLLCGRHLSTKQLQEEMHELKSIADFWDRSNNRVPRDSHFRDVFTEEISRGGVASLKSEQRFVPVRRIEMIDSYHAREFEYPALKTIPEVDHPLAQMAYRRADAKTQQAIRLRFTDDAPKLLVVFGNRLLPGFVISGSVLFADLVLANRPGSESRKI